MTTQLHSHNTRRDYRREIWKWKTMNKLHKPNNVKDAGVDLCRRYSERKGPTEKSFYFKPFYGSTIKKKENNLINLIYCLYVNNDVFRIKYISFYTNPTILTQVQ